MEWHSLREQDPLGGYKLSKGPCRYKETATWTTAMLKTKSVYEEPLEEQLETLLMQDPQLLPAAITRRMADKNLLSEGDKIEQRICSLFMCLYHLKCDPQLEDEWRLGIEQQYSEQLSVLARQLIRREQRNQLAGLELEEV